jgi:hypothetical protein
MGKETLGEAAAILEKAAGPLGYRIECARNIEWEEKPPLIPGSQEEKAAARGELRITLVRRGN